MPKRLKLTSPMPESVNHYFRYRAFIQNGRAKAMGYKTDKASEYQKEFGKHVIEQVNIQGWEMNNDKFQHYYVDADFYFPRIDKDPNNYWKLLLDAITQTGVVWLDDNVTCERVNKICYDSDNPRIELEIYPVDYIGIFDNADQLVQFESRCAGCKRYKQNCSILRKAKEGRVQPEITDGVCASYAELKTKKKTNKRRK